MTTTEALRSGAGTLAETAAGAMSELADKARSHTESVVGGAKDMLTERHRSPHRGRRVLLAVGALGAAAAAVQLLRRTKLGQQVQERVIDLTHHADPEPAVTLQDL